MQAASRKPQAASRKPQQSNEQNKGSVRARFLGFSR
jgi:hypothetical protein